MEVTGTQTTVGVNYITVIAVRIQNNCSNTERIDRPADYMKYEKQRHMRLQTERERDRETQKHRERKMNTN